MLINVNFQTHYRYAVLPSFGIQRLHMRPLDSVEQTIHGWAIEVEGAQIELGYQDHYGNWVDLARVEAGVDEVIIKASGRVETHNVAGVHGFDQPRVPGWVFRRQTPTTRLGTKLRKFTAAHGNNDGSLAFFHELADQIRNKVTYAVDTTDVDTTAEDAWGAGSGVCQDHSHIMIGVTRELGYPARYVSGYLFIEGQIDQSATHAWCEVFVPTLGWVGFDVSNGYSPDERYIRVAVGLDYSDAPPVRGIRYGAGAETLEVTLQIQQ